MRRSPSQFNWCRGWDSNPHALSGTAPSTQPVYQFQHPGQFRQFSGNLPDDAVYSHHLANTLANTAADHVQWTSRGQTINASDRASAFQSYRETQDLPSRRVSICPGLHHAVMSAQPEFALSP